MFPFGRRSAEATDLPRSDCRQEILRRIDRNGGAHRAFLRPAFDLLGCCPSRSLAELAEEDLRDFPGWGRGVCQPAFGSGEFSFVPSPPDVLSVHRTERIESLQAKRPAGKPGPHWTPGTGTKCQLASSASIEGSSRNVSALAARCGKTKKKSRA